MTVNERIKISRKKANLSQKELASKIGMSQNSISWSEKDGNNVSDSTIKSICSVLSINENWLRTGEGNPEICENPIDSFRRAADSVSTGSHDMDLIVRGILDSYANMDDDCRKLFWDYLQKIVNLVSNPVSKQSSVPDEETLEKQYETKDVHDNVV